MGMDARKLEKLIITICYGKLSKITELKELGQKLYDIVKINVPYLTDEIESNAIDNDIDPFKQSKRPNIKIVQKPILISNTPNIDETIINSYIMYHYQCSLNEVENIKKELEDKEKEYKIKIMHII